MDSIHIEAKSTFYQFLKDKIGTQMNVSKKINQWYGILIWLFGFPELSKKSGPLKIVVSCRNSTVSSTFSLPPEQSLS